MISIPEATIAGDLRAESQWASHSLRKQKQFRGYPSAAKVRIAELTRAGQAVSQVEVQVHYMSDTVPSEATIKIMEDQLRQAGPPNVTIFWHKL
jgi:glutathionylspermidine synthase